jgi:hypothetical protein
MNAVDAVDTWPAALATHSRAVEKTIPHHRRRAVLAFFCRLEAKFNTAP